MIAFFTILGAVGLVAVFVLLVGFVVVAIEHMFEDKDPE